MLGDLTNSDLLKMAAVLFGSTLVIGLIMRKSADSKDVEITKETIRSLPQDHPLQVAYFNEQERIEDLAGDLQDALSSGNIEQAREITDEIGLASRTDNNEFNSWFYSWDWWMDSLKTGSAK